MPASISETVVLCWWSSFFLVRLFWERRATAEAYHSVLPTAMNMKATAPPRYEVNDSHAQVRARTVHLLKASCEHIDASIRVIRFSVGDNDINISVKRRRAAGQTRHQQQQQQQQLGRTNDWPEPNRDARRFIVISDALFFWWRVLVTFIISIFCLTVLVIISFFCYFITS